MRNYIFDIMHNDKIGAIRQSSSGIMIEEIQLFNDS